MNRKILFVVLLIVSALPFMTPAYGLALGLAFALALGNPHPKFAKKTSKYLLQASVVGIGFGMNLTSAIRAGGGGMAFTILSVALVMAVGVALGKMLKTDAKASYLISAGTAICGGSAIAAVAPVVKADDSQMSVALATVFTLNAVALFVFPAIGHLLGLSEIQFGEWAAIAIHDTSSVVGAGAAYGDQALQTATLIKCTRALWIVPLGLVTTFVWREKGAKLSVPWFIVLFAVAMTVNTFLPQTDAVVKVTRGIAALAKHAMSVTLFLIGSGLSLAAVRQVGPRPFVQGIALWAMIAAVSLGVILALR